MYFSYQTEMHFHVWNKQYMDNITGRNSIKCLTGEFGYPLNAIQKECRFTNCDSGKLKIEGEMYYIPSGKICKFKNGKNNTSFNRTAQHSNGLSKIVFSSWI